MKHAKNILAVEGEWTNRLDDKETVKSTLTFLFEVYGVDYIFRKANTLGSLVSYLDKGTKDSYKKYGIILIAFHGTEKGIELDNDKLVSLNKLAKKCEGFFDNKLVHFSSCAVAKDLFGLKNFKALTGAKKVMGYSKNVDFLESTLFDIALLQKLNEFNAPGKVNTHMKDNYTSLYEKLGFVMV